jgi:hypothetical protein
MISGRGRCRNSSGIRFSSGSGRDINHLGNIGNNKKTPTRTLATNINYLGLSKQTTIEFMINDMKNIFNFVNDTGTIFEYLKDYSIEDKIYSLKIGLSSNEVMKIDADKQYKIDLKQNKMHT